MFSDPPLLLPAKHEEKKTRPARIAFCDLTVFDPLSTIITLGLIALGRGYKPSYEFL